MPPRTATASTRAALANREERRPRATRRTAAEAPVEPGERSRLGQELHDGPAQLLVVALMQVRAASQRVARGDTPGLELDNLGALLHTALDDLRTLSRDLGGQAPPRFSLQPALAELARHSSSALLSVELRGNPASLEHLTPAAGLELFRVAQTALGNVIRHSGAKRCTLSLSESKGNLSLQIEDDGSGFNLLFCDWGMGLTGIRERAGALGGSCALDTAPGRGTLVRIDVPITAGSPACKPEQADALQLRRRDG